MLTCVAFKTMNTLNSGLSPKAVISKVITSTLYHLINFPCLSLTAIVECVKNSINQIKYSIHCDTLGVMT